MYNYFCDLRPHRQEIKKLMIFLKMPKIGTKYYNSFPANVTQIFGKTVFFPVNSLVGHFRKNMTLVLIPCKVALKTVVKFA